MCRLRDVLEVFGGFRPSFWGLEDPGEREYATCATFWMCFCRIHVFLVAFSSTSQNVVFARRFGGVSLKVQLCLGVFFLTGVNVWFARRFGGVRRLWRKCFGAWKIPASGNMRLARCFGGVSLKVQMC